MWEKHFLHWAHSTLKKKGKEKGKKDPSLTLPSLDVPATCPVAMVTMSGWMARLQREH